MTPEEQHLYAVKGENSILNIIGLVFMAGGYGILVLISSIAIWHIRLQPTGIKRQWPKIISLVCFIAMFLLSTLVFLSTITTTLTVLSFIAGKITLPHEGLQFVDWQNLNPPSLVLMVLLNDCMVVWRAWILLPELKFWRITLVVLALANTGINIADLVVDELESSDQILNDFFASLDWIAIFASLLVNGVGTLLIMWKWWVHNRGFSWRKKSQSVKVLLLLVESGAIFCGAQILYIISTMVGTYTSTNTLGFLEFVHVGNTVFQTVVAWYPAAVIILIHAKQNLASIVETNSVVVTSQLAQELATPSVSTAKSSQKLL